MKHHNKFDYSKYGNTHGADFLVKVLKERIKCGMPNSIKIHKKVKIFSTNEEHVFDLVPNQTTPTSLLLDVEDGEENELLVKLKVV